MTTNKITAGVLAASAAALVASGCYYKTPGRAVVDPRSVMTTPATTAVAAPPPTTTAGTATAPMRSEPLPQSFIADISLPLGSRYDDVNSTDSMELWNPHMGYGDAVAELTPLLPIGKPMEGLPWCFSDTATGQDGWDWTWATRTEAIQVDVLNFFGTPMISVALHTPRGALLAQIEQHCS